MQDLIFRHASAHPDDWSVEIYESDHTEVRTVDGKIFIGVRAGTHAKDLISIVNFQIGYELLRRFSA